MPNEGSRIIYLYVCKRTDGKTRPSHQAGPARFMRTALRQLLALGELDRFGSGKGRAQASVDSLKELTLYRRHRDDKRKSLDSNGVKDST